MVLLYSSLSRWASLRHIQFFTVSIISCCSSVYCWLVQCLFFYIAKISALPASVTVSCMFSFSVGMFWYFFLNIFVAFHRDLSLMFKFCDFFSEPDFCVHLLSFGCGGFVGCKCFYMIVPESCPESSCRFWRKIETQKI